MRVSIRFNAPEAEKFQSMLIKSGLNSSELIKDCLFKKDIIYLDRGKDIYQALMRINHEIYILEENYPKVSTDRLREEVYQACRMLNS